MKNDAISRSAVINVLQELADKETAGEAISDIGFGLSMAIGRLISAPALDAVPVVRCRECKHWGVPPHAYETEHVKCCENGNYMMEENEYCSLGEREDGRGVKEFENK